MVKKYLVTKVPAHHLYHRTDFHSRVKLCVIEILLTSLKAAYIKAISHRPNIFFSNLRVRFHSEMTLRRSLGRPAIKDDINFFLDFDFQPLYTFINCGFLLRTAHP
jgi:hypothetical protein